MFSFGICDEWGGAESRGNGARPVEWMIMNDTCATHRSRVPRRSFGRNKRRSDNIGRRERTRPGFYFMFCVRQSSARGCRFSVMFVYLIKCVKCSPVPASFFPYIRTALHWCRSPGGRRDTLSESPRCWVGSRCWEDRAAGSGGDRQWLPEAVVLEQKKNRWDGRLAAVLLGRGGVAAVREGAEESPRSPGGRSLLPSAMFGEEQGTGDSLPAALDRRSHRRPPGGGWASGRPPKRSSTIAWHREWTAQLVEDRAAVCPDNIGRREKSRPGPLSSSNVVTPPFIPSEAPPWDSRPVSGAGVVHYHSLHRPRSVPTALGPAPLVTVSYHSWLHPHTKLNHDQNWLYFFYYMEVTF